MRWKLRWENFYTRSEGAAFLLVSRLHSIYSALVSRNTKLPEPIIPLNSDQINDEYIKSLREAPGVIFQRLERHIAPRHKRKIDELTLAGVNQPAFQALDHMGDVLLDAYSDVKSEIRQAQIDKHGATPDPQKLEQSVMQGVKSNAGKIFERYVGYGLAIALRGTGWAVWHNRQDASEVFGYNTSEYLQVALEFNGEEICIDIEGDILIARPNEPESPLIVVSIKSTLKDRLHNVALWGLVKKVAADPVASKAVGLRAVHPEKLSKVIYVLACADTAQEQTDLASTPRRKIQFDVALLDFAFAALSSQEAEHLSREISKDGRGADMFHRLSAIGLVLDHIHRMEASGQEPDAETVVQKTLEDTAS